MVQVGSNYVSLIKALFNYFADSSFICLYLGYYQESFILKRAVIMHSILVSVYPFIVSDMPYIHPLFKLCKPDIPSIQCCLSLFKFIAGGPVKAVANVLGTINQIDFGLTLIANVSADMDGYAKVIAQLYDVPPDVGKQIDHSGGSRTHLHAVS